MIVQNEKHNTEISDAQAPEVPQIISEEDIPFDCTSLSNQIVRPSSLAKTDSLDDAITKFKYATGKTVLFISMGAMGVAVVASILLSLFNIENTLVENAFEVFKLIAMTVLGYIFGSKAK